MKESHQRRAIRIAVERRGFSLTRLEWEPIGAGAEKSGPSGGWFGYVEPEPEHGNPGVMGYNVAEALEWVEEFLH